VQLEQPQLKVLEVEQPQLKVPELHQPPLLAPQLEEPQQPGLVELLQLNGRHLTLDPEVHRHHRHFHCPHPTHY
jgi:hypothetical protein